MPEFVRRHNDPREASSVLHYGHAVDLLQSLVDHAGPAHVGKPRGASVAVTVAGLSSENISVRKQIFHGDSGGMKGWHAVCFSMALR